MLTAGVYIVDVCLLIIDYSSPDSVRVFLDEVVETAANAKPTSGEILMICVFVSITSD